MQAYGFDALAAFYVGEISLRKLDAMCRFLPENSPAFWHLHEGRSYTLEHQLLWNLAWSMWELQVLTARCHGNKKAKMPQDKIPRYPWTPVENANTMKLGSLGSHTAEEALDYLDNL